MCDYGCGQPALFQLKNGKNCCSENYTQCPAIRAKNSAGLKKAYHEQRLNAKLIYQQKSQQAKDAQAWARGKTSLSDPRIRTKATKIFTANSDANHSLIRKMILAEKLLPYQCAICQIYTWQNQPLTLELDHINGIKKDQRLENLRFLCPNCHSQTPTYKGKNNTGKEKVTDQELIKAIQTSTSIHAALLKVNLAPKGGNYNRVKNLIKQHQLSFAKTNPGNSNT